MVSSRWRSTRLYRDVQEADGAVRWAQAKVDPAFKAEVDDIAAGAPGRRDVAYLPVTPAPLRWAVVLIDFDPATGHEQAGTRRALVGLV